MGDCEPKVLVLLAACNGEGWIREQIDSILSQAGVDVRVVVCDDGSTDATRSEVERFAPTGRVRLVRACPKAGSAAQNFLSLIRANPADGFDYVAFSDQDDIWNVDKLQRAHHFLTSIPAAGYSSAVTAVWEDGHSITMRQADSCTEADFLFEGAGQGCTFVLSACFYERARAFYLEHRVLTQPLHYHDWATYALARVWGARWFFDPRPSLRYRQHQQNDTGARYTFGGVRKRIGSITNGWYRRQIDAVTKLCLVAAPENPRVAEWAALFDAPPGLIRRLKVGYFCLRHGRRKAIDNAVVVMAAFAGLI